MKEDPKKIILDNVRVATPCTADWDKMDGTEKERFCAQCKLHVYNLSAMSRGEAEQFLAKKKGGRRCIRFFRRQDGTILTDDCPMMLRRLRRAGKRCAAFFAALTSLIFSAACARAQESAGDAKDQQESDPRLLGRASVDVRAEEEKNKVSGDEKTGPVFFDLPGAKSGHRMVWVMGDEGGYEDLDEIKARAERPNASAQDKHEYDYRQIEYDQQNGILPQPEMVLRSQKYWEEMFHFMTPILPQAKQEKPNAASKNESSQSEK